MPSICAFLTTRFLHMLESKLILTEMHFLILKLSKFFINIVVDSVLGTLRKVWKICTECYFTFVVFFMKNG